jgi:hypothetical protein
LGLRLPVSWKLILLNGQYHPMKNFTPLHDTRIIL